MKDRILICGGGGFIGSHLAKKLYEEDNFVRVADIKYDGYFKDRYFSQKCLLDLRILSNCYEAVMGMDYVYNLAANMGGIGYITAVNAEVMRDNVLINTNMLEACRIAGIKRYFYSSSACFLPDTEIITNPSYKLIKDMIAGDKVLTEDGSYHPVEKVGSRPYSGDMFRIQTYGIDIACTPTHPFLVDNKGNKSWKAAQDLTIKDYLVIPKPISSGQYPTRLKFLPDKYASQNKAALYLESLGRKLHSKESAKVAEEYHSVPSTIYAYSRKYPHRQPRFRQLPLEIAVSKEFTELLGIFIAEGWVERGSIVFAFNDSETEYSAECVRLVKSIFNIESHTSKMKNQNGFKVEFHSQFLSDFFKTVAYDNSGKCGAAHKALPSWLFHTPKEFREAFIRGYWLGDGSATYQPPRHWIISCSTVSPTLFWQLRTLLLQLGIMPSIYKPKRPTTHFQLRKIKCLQSYQLLIRGNKSKEYLLSLIDKELPKCEVQNHRDRIRYYNDYFAIPIKNILKETYSGLVWNLEVEGNHTYTVQHAAVHNCIYPNYKQTTADLENLRPTILDGRIKDPNRPAPGLKESDDMPADPNEAYGWEKLFTEFMAMFYQKDYGLDVRIARFHNVFGPFGTFDGGREKAPAAICRKVAKAKNQDILEIWGDGTQTRSFCYIDDCVRGVIALMQSDCHGPLNIGTDRLVTINQMADIIIGISGKKITKQYLPNMPVGVMGRNADLTLVKAVLGWEPIVPLEEGLKATYKWIREQVLG